MSTTRSEPVLSVTGVRKSFGGFIAVDDVSFELFSGEVLGIAGPNGAGKSTVFNLVTGIPHGPDAGSVHLAGRRIDRLRPHTISRMGVRRTFQSESLFDSLSVAENIAVSQAYAGVPRRKRRAESERLLELTGLASTADADASELPLVSKKQLMIATALVGDPMVLLLDEPAGGLDEQDQHRLAELIATINVECGVALVVIEHVLGLLRRVANRLLVLTAGTVLAEGSPNDVLADQRVAAAYLGGAANRAAAPPAEGR